MSVRASIQVQPRRRSWRVAVVVLLAAVTPLGCLAEDELVEDEELDFSQEGVVIGTNDLLLVARDGANVPARYRASLDGFGRLLVGGAACTATHVGAGVVISAGHCFGAPAGRVNDQPCANARVEWGYRDGVVTSNSGCTRILAMQTGGGLDYAIFRVAPVPAVALPIALDVPAQNGTGLTLFTHAAAKPLQWSKLCTVLPSSANQLGYTCDTQGGSSGAAVLRDDTLQVIGIHWGGTSQANLATRLAATPLREFVGAQRHVSRQSGKCLDVSGAGTADGTAIHLWTCNGTGAQAFRLRDAGNGRVNLVNSNSNKCVDVAASGTADGTKIQLWTCNGTGAQAFELRDAGGGEAQLVNATSGKCVDVAGAGSADGTAVHQWSCHGGDNQKWRGWLL